MKKRIGVILLLGIMVALFGIAVWVWGVTMDSKETIKATWLWHANTITDKETTDFILNRDVTAVYLQINRDVDQKDYATFIESMQVEDIEIQALAGSPDWTIQDFNKLWTWIKHYHENYPQAKFSGIHLDVEPYLTDLWDENEEEAIYTFQVLIEYVGHTLKNEKIHLEMDIPFWFDGVEYDNSFGTGNLAEWCIEKADRVAIMAYRDTLDAIIRITEKELEYGQKHSTPIIIGIETKPSSEGDKVSFAEEGESKMNEVLKDLYHHFEENNFFDGVAIHHLHSWQKMKK